MKEARPPSQFSVGGASKRRADSPRPPEIFSLRVSTKAWPASDVASPNVSVSTTVEAMPQQLFAIIRKKTPRISAACSLTPGSVPAHHAHRVDGVRDAFHGFAPAFGQLTQRERFV